MIYFSWTMQLNILMQLSSVLHECWCCIETFLGFLRIFNVKFISMERHGIPWWEPLFEGMCYMDGMCFAMLAPMLYISVCRKICGVTCGKGFAHVLMVSSIVLDQVYRTYSACG